MRGIHGRLSGRVTEDSRKKEDNPLPPINRLPDIQSLSSAPFKKGVSPPHITFCIESYRYKEGEEEGARGSEREREGVRGGAQMTRTQSPQRILLDIPPSPPITKYNKTCGFNPNLSW